MIHSELPADWRMIEALTENPTAELRAAILSLDRADEPVAVCRRYDDPTVEAVAVKAAADLGRSFWTGWRTAFGSTRRIFRKRRSRRSS